MKGFKDNMRKKPPESTTNQASYDLTENKETSEGAVGCLHGSMGLHQVLGTCAMVVDIEFLWYS